MNPELIYCPNCFSKFDCVTTLLNGNKQFHCHCHNRLILPLYLYSLYYALWIDNKYYLYSDNIDTTFIVEDHLYNYNIYVEPIIEDNHISYHKMIDKFKRILTFA